MASLSRQNVHNADLRVAGPDTADSHVLVIVSFDHSATALHLRSSSANLAVALNSSAVVVRHKL
jgi:hypothetical protein